MKRPSESAGAEGGTHTHQDRGALVLQPTRNARHCMVASHGTPHTMAMGLAEYGEMCPGDTVDGEFPMYGFSGTCGEFSTENIRSSIAKVASKAKGAA